MTCANTCRQQAPHSPLVHLLARISRQRGRESVCGVRDTGHARSGNRDPLAHQMGGLNDSRATIILFSEFKNLADFAEERHARLGRHGR